MSEPHTGYAYPKVTLQEGAIHESTHNRPFWKRRRPLLLITAGVLLLSYVFASGQMKISPANLFAGQPCSITISSTGPWPERIDTSTIHVDGLPVRTLGTGVTTPFGSTTVELFNQAGDGLASCHTFTYDAGRFPGPLGRVTFTLP